MTTAADPNQGQQPANQTPAQPQGQQPNPQDQLPSEVRIAGQFKDEAALNQSLAEIAKHDSVKHLSAMVPDNVESMPLAYRERLYMTLRSQLSQGQQQPAQSQQPQADQQQSQQDQQGTGLGQTQVSNEAIMQGAGLNDEAIMAAAKANNGQVSADHLAAITASAQKLLGPNVTSQMVQSYLQTQVNSQLASEQTAQQTAQNLQQFQQQARQQAEQFAGGADRLANLLAFKNTLPPDRVASLNQRLEDPNLYMGALQEIAGEHATKFGRTGQMLTGQSPSNTPDLYESREEWAKDFNDPRYKSDPRFYAKVQAKADRSFKAGTIKALFS